MIQLQWVDPHTGEPQDYRGELPIAIGRTALSLPRTLDGARVTPLVLANPDVEPFHASLRPYGDGTVLIAESNVGVTALNELPLMGDTLVADGDVIRVASYELQVTVEAIRPSVPEQPSFAHSQTDTIQAAASGNPAEMGAPLGEDAVLSSFAGASSSASERPSASSPPRSAGLTDFELGRACQNRVGFLFKRRCGRTDPAGCRYCRGTGRVIEDIYYNDYDTYYPGYGRYRGWGGYHYRNRDRYYYDRDSERMAFTEADGDALEEEADMDFERDFEAS